MSAPHGRPKGRQSIHEAAQRRTAVTPLYVLLLRNLKNYDEAVEFVGKGARGG